LASVRQLHEKINPEGGFKIEVHRFNLKLFHCQNCKTRAVVVNEIVRGA
jgi:primosomal protein N''